MVYTACDIAGYSVHVLTDIADYSVLVLTVPIIGLVDREVLPVRERAENMSRASLRGDKCAVVIPLCHMKVSSFII